MDMNTQNVAVFLGQHADKVIALIQMGFFEMKSGSITVHFDGTGKMRKYEKNTVLTL